MNRIEPDTTLVVVWIYRVVPRRDSSYVVFGLGIICARSQSVGMLRAYIIIYLYYERKQSNRDRI